MHLALLYTSDPEELCIIPGMLKRNIYLGLFLVSMSSLMFEILLTRIFSITQWYHFAFLAVSIALFGMTVGSLLVYLLPGFFTEARLRLSLSLSAMLFGIWAILSVLIHMSMPFAFAPSFVGIFSTAVTYAVISLPFIFSGICVSLALTRFSFQVSKLYMADLVGASLGCVLLLYLLKFADGPSMTFVIGALACLAAVAFAWDAGSPRLLRSSLAAAVVLGVLALIQVILVNQQKPLITFVWSKGKPEPQALYQKWNSFSRVRVWGDPKLTTQPFGSAANPDLLKSTSVRWLSLDIDSDAYTPIYGYNGDPATMQFLKYDISSLAHYMRPDSRVLVIGAGGGKDILSALVFDQKSVTAVEINENISSIVNGVFGDFSGHLDRNPKVNFVVDEARSYITRSSEQYDIIQASLIDTWAATSAGAYVLSENSLYTQEAWGIFLDHLSPDGLLTFSRWYDENNPVQMYRLVALATQSLLNQGIREPRNHILVAVSMFETDFNTPQVGISTLLISKMPFSPSQVANFKDTVSRLGFQVVLTPDSSIDANFAAIASGKNLQAIIDRFPANISPTTDNSPFFFQALRLSDVILKGPGAGSFGQGASDVAVYILGVLLIIVFCLTGLCILVPLTLTKKRIALKGSGSLFVYFTAIGLGYMMVEISQMQRLVVFLGHPSYSLSVVLFALLLSSGLGSATTGRISLQRLSQNIYLRLGLLLGLLVVFGLFTPLVTRSLQSAVTPVRVLAAVGVLFPAGFFMGMAFPMGMKVASTVSETITPWLWGINGAASVLASVLSVVIALSSGFSATFWTGFACYAVAIASQVVFLRTRPLPS